MANVALALGRRGTRLAYMFKVLLGFIRRNPKQLCSAQRVCCVGFGVVV